MPETPPASARAAKRISVSGIAPRGPPPRAGGGGGGEGGGERERREERGDHGRVADAAVEAQADDRLELLGPARRRRGVEGADPLPVAGLAHGAGGARAAAVGRHGVGLDAAPGLDRGGAAPR